MAGAAGASRLGLGAAGQTAGAYAGQLAVRIAGCGPDRRLRAGSPAAGLNSATIALRGELPTAQEFMDGAVLILGFNAGAKLSGPAGARVRAVRDKLIDINERTGLRPETVAEAASERPHIKEALLSGKELSPEILKEMRQIREGYKRVREDPLGGPADEVLATISPEGLKRIFVERGPAVMRDGEIVVQGHTLKRADLSKRGFGLVKIIFRHGEKGNKNPKMPPVLEEDVVNLPRYIREFEPTKEAGAYRWAIPRRDGNLLIIALGENSKSEGMRLVTMFVEHPNMPASKKILPQGPLPSGNK